MEIYSKIWANYMLKIINVKKKIFLSKAYGFRHRIIIIINNNKEITGMNSCINGYNFYYIKTPKTI